VKTRFHIHDNGMFLFASPGSTHNEGGKEHPSVRFNPERLPLGNLHLGISDSTRKQSRPLQRDELIPFALKIEGQHWIKSAIKALYPEFASENKPPKSSLLVRSQQIDNSDGALFLAFATDVLQTKAGSHVFLNKSQLVACFHALLDREIEAYRRDSAPLFAYIRDKVKHAAATQAPRRRIWNQRQVVALCSNCYWYGRANSIETFHYQLSGVSGVGKFMALFFDSYIISSSEHLSKSLWEAYNPDLDIGGMYGGTNIVPEFSQWNEAFHWGAWSGRNDNYPIALGTFMVHRVALADFIEKVFKPSVLTEFIEKVFVLSQFPDMDVQRVAEGLNAAALGMREEISSNKDMAQNNCNQPQDFNSALQAGKLVLKAQAEFWKALHRQLMALET
jgi:hypothetical protein